MSVTDSVHHPQVTESVRELHLRGCFLYRSRWGSYASSLHSLSPSLSSFTLPELRKRCPHLKGLFLSDMALAFDTSGAVPTLADFPETLEGLALRDSQFQGELFFQDDPSEVWWAQ